MAVIRLKKNMVTFVYDGSSEAKKVYLAGDFNNWDPTDRRMVKVKGGTYRAKMELQPGNYEYKFVIDGEWVNDPSGEATVENALGSSNSLVCIE